MIPSLYGEVYIPPAVASELAVPVSHLPPMMVDRMPFLRVQSPTNREQVQKLQDALNAGEAEAIALAVEVRADALLIDEAKGRRLAIELGVRPIGLLGVLSLAKTRGFVPAIRPMIEQLRQRISFRIDPRLLDRVLKDAGE